MRKRSFARSSDSAKSERCKGTEKFLSHLCSTHDPRLWVVRFLEGLPGYVELSHAGFVIGSHPFGFVDMLPQPRVPREELPRPLWPGPLALSLGTGRCRCTGQLPLVSDPPLPNAQVSSCSPFQVSCGKFPSLLSAVYLTQLYMRGSPPRCAWKVSAATAALCVL